MTKQLAVTHPRTTKRTAFIEPLAPAPPQILEQIACESLAPEEADTLISAAAQRESLSPDLLRAVIRHESAFNPCAVSDKGAQGLMQLMPSTAVSLNVTDPFDPKQNIRGGAAYLRQLMERYSGDASLALSAYNAGPQQVDRSAGVPNIPETQNYVTSILGELGLALPAKQQPIAEALPEQIQPEQVEEEASQAPTENAIHNVVLQLSLGSSESKPSSVRLGPPNK